jgi:hypothetical protein
MRAPSIAKPGTPRLGVQQLGPFLEQPLDSGPCLGRTGGIGDEMEVSAMLVGGDVG